MAFPEGLGAIQLGETRMHQFAGRRAALRIAGLGLAFGAIGGAMSTATAQESGKLFKIITAKDEITIGVTGAELAAMERANNPLGLTLPSVTAGELSAMGRGEEVRRIAELIVRAGQITVWQYAVGRDASGALQMNPLRRIAILKNDTLRIEPETTPYKIVPPKP